MAARVVEARVAAKVAAVSSAVGVWEAEAMAVVLREEEVTVMAGKVAEVMAVVMWAAMSRVVTTVAEVMEVVEVVMLMAVAAHAVVA